MPDRRIRGLLALAATSAVLLAGLSGHSLPQTDMHDGMAGAAAGLCVLLATILASAALVKPAVRSRPLVLRTVEVRAEPGSPPLDARARASPISLQRFRN